MKSKANAVVQSRTVELTFAGVALLALALLYCRAGGVL